MAATFLRENCPEQDFVFRMVTLEFKAFHPALVSLPDPRGDTLAVSNVLRPQTMDCGHSAIKGGV